MSAARAVLFGTKDGYAAIGLYALALHSASRHFFEGLGLCVIAGLVLELWFSRSRDRLGAGVVAGACVTALVAYLFIAGLVPSLPMHAPDARTMRGQLAHTAAGLCAITIAVLFAVGDRLGTAVVRSVVGGAAGLTTIAAGALLMSISSSDRTGPSGEARPNVILISLDTVRADHLGCYGHSRATTPEIDRFFSKGSIRFEAAFAPQPWTLTSHMTMLTSLQPDVHGVNAEHGLPPRVLTLAQILTDAGYLAAGYVFDLIWMEERFGFDRGFHIYRRFYDDARSRNRLVKVLLDDLKVERFFLFLHYYDAHSDRGELPYQSDPMDRTELTGTLRRDFKVSESGGRRGTDLLWWMNQAGATLSEEDRRYLVDLYDAGLRSLDRALGELFRQLEDRGLLDNTIVVLTSDHGEEFLEHGKVLHTQFYDECMRVPLLFRAPGRGSACSLPTLVGLVDLAPTILELCGITPIPDMQGRSLRALIDGEQDTADRRHVLLVDEKGHQGLRTATWKLLTTGAGRELYNLCEDPGERLNLLTAGMVPPHAEFLLRTLEQEQVHASELRSRVGDSGNGSISITESEAESLRALGYLDEDF